MKKFLLSSTLLLLLLNVFGQRHFTKTGQISFYSEAPVENIEATNNKVTAITDVKSGAIEFAVLMKAFLFEKALMQEHFNENYVESDKYPKAKFVGKITDSKLLSKKGTHKTTAEGELTIHGETKKITVPVELVVGDTEIAVNTKFTITLADYKIEIPTVVKDNISKTIDITVKTNLKPFK